MKTVRIATRKSKLALAQSRIVAELLNRHGYETVLVPVSTLGDRILDKPLEEIGGKGVFVSEIETMLLLHEADIAVHSAKDLPYELAKGLCIAATPVAEDSRDALITLPSKKREEIRVIGTGSNRRKSQLKELFPQADFQSIRGNVDTRLAKLQEGYDGVVLAMAGLKRLGISEKDFCITPFETTKVIPAACQGMIAVECRCEDREIYGKLNDEKIYERFLIETAVLRKLDADCSTDIGVFFNEGIIHVKLNGRYVSGKTIEEVLEKLS